MPKLHHIPLGSEKRKPVHLDEHVSYREVKPKKMPRSIRTKVAVKEPTGHQEQSAYQKNAAI